MTTPLPSHHKAKVSSVLRKVLRTEHIQTLGAGGTRLGKARSTLRSTEGAGDRVPI